MYLVMNIGCIECGVSSNVVGIFEDKNKAVALAEEFDSKFSWRQGGQNSFEVFELPGVGVINDEYKDNG